MTPRRRAGCALAPLLISLAGACGDVGAPPASPFPSNRCPPDSCDAYPQTESNRISCSAGQCTSSESIDFTLVVSLSATQGGDPSVTFAMPDFMSQYLRQPSNACAKLPVGSCARIQSSTEVQGSYVVTPSLQLCAGRPEDTGGASLPVSVQLWPLWASSDGALATVAASSVNLPLLPITGRAFQAEPGNTPGPSGTPPTQWSAVFSPGAYEEDVFPLDTAYPPYRLTGVLSGGLQSARPVDTGECAPSSTLYTTFEVTRGNGSLAGFSVYFRDATTRRRVSSIGTLPDAASGTVTILTSNGLWPNVSPGDFDLVIAPPDGAPIPTYVDPIETAQIAATSYPSLPSPITVSGTVRALDGSVIESDLVIDSTAPDPNAQTGGIVICTDAACSSTTTGTTPRPLSYSTTAHSSPIDGSYSVALPPGTYDAFVIPAVGAHAGAASVPILVQAAKAGFPPVAAGKELLAAGQETIIGIVGLADGRPLVGATVEAHVAAATASSALDRRRWPRTATGLSDVTGSFSLVVDPGIYDVVVRPVDGTGFPWVTRRGVTAPAVLAMTVPAPIAIPMTLLDPGNNPIAGAIVSAYAWVAGPPATQIQLGTWITDDTGAFSMFVTPP